MKNKNENNSPGDETLDRLLSSHPVQVSSDFTERTLAKIKSGDLEADNSNKLIYFPQLAAAAAAVVVILTVLYVATKSTDKTEDKVIVATTEINNPTTTTTSVTEKHESVHTETATKKTVIAAAESTTVDKKAIEPLIVAETSDNESNDVYTDNDYLEYEELLLMNEALTFVASVDDYSNLNLLLQN